MTRLEPRRPAAASEVLTASTRLVSFARGALLNPGPQYRAMTGFASFADLRAACLDLPAGDGSAAATAARRDAMLTKPPGSLGRLEDVVVWLARWQGRAMPRLDRVEVLVFAGNHGVVAQGVSAYPAGGHRADGGELRGRRRRHQPTRGRSGGKPPRHPAFARRRHRGLHAATRHGRGCIPRRRRRRL